MSTDPSSRTQSPLDDRVTTVSGLLESTGVRGIVVGNPKGELVGRVGENPDAENSAAIIAVIARGLADVGLTLKLGSLQTAVVKRPDTSVILAEQSGAIVLVDLVPRRSTADVEAVLRDSQWASPLMQRIGDLSVEPDESPPLVSDPSPEIGGVDASSASEGLDSTRAEGDADAVRAEGDADATSAPERSDALPVSEVPEEIDIELDAAPETIQPAPPESSSPQSCVDLSDEVIIDVESEPAPIGIRFPEPPRPRPRLHSQLPPRVPTKPPAPVFREHQVPADAKILDDSWSIDEALAPPPDPTAELRRALIRGKVDVAQSLGASLSAISDEEAANPQVSAAKMADQEALRALVGQIAILLAGDGRRGLAELRNNEPPPTTSASIRWARQIWLARTQVSSGLPLEQAQKDADQAMEIASELDAETRAVTLLVQAEVAVSAGRSEAALGLLDAARALFVTTDDRVSLAHTWLLEARALADLHREDESQSAAQRARSQRPSWPAPVAFIAQQALKTGQLARADAALQPMLGRAPRPPEIDRLRRVLELVRCRDMTEQEGHEFLQLAEGRAEPSALAELERLAQRYPTFCGIREVMGWMFLKAGEYQRASDEFRRYLLEPTLSPEERSTVLLALGCLATARARNEKTGVKLRAAVLAAPHDLPQSGHSGHSNGPDPFSAVTEPPPEGERRIPSGVSARPKAPGWDPEHEAMLGLAHSPVFAGSLRVCGLPDLLELLGHGQRTGTLVCASDAGIGAIQMRSGRLTGAASPKAPGVGQQLIERGVMTAAQLAEVLSARATDGSNELLGALLVERHLVEPEVMRDALCRQIKSAVSELISWTDGQFAFDAEAVVATQPSEINVEIEPQVLILDIAKEFDEAQR